MSQQPDLPNELDGATGGGYTPAAPQPVPGYNDAAIASLCPTCRHFCGSIGGQLLVCAMHPYGPSGETCNDRESVSEWWRDWKKGRRVRVRATGQAGVITAIWADGQIFVAIVDEQTEYGYSRRELQLLPDDRVESSGGAGGASDSSGPCNEAYLFTPDELAEMRPGGGPPSPEDLTEVRQLRAILAQVYYQARPIPWPLRVWRRLRRLGRW